MFIQNNALNMNVSGIHSFDHDISYNVQTNALQAIGSKLGKANKARRPRKKLKKNMLFDLHYTINGTVDDYVYKRNKAAVQRNFDVSLAKKEKIRRVLEDSFGAFDLSSTVTSNTTKPKPEPKKETPAPTPSPKPKKEVIQASLDNAIPEFEVEEDDFEYIEFQGDDGD